MSNNKIVCHFRYQLNSEERQQYDQFIHSCRSQTFMQSSDWPEVYTPTRVQRFAYIWCTIKNGQWLSAGLVRLTKVTAGRYLASFLRGPVFSSIPAIRTSIPTMMKTLKHEGVFSAMVVPHAEGDEAIQVSETLAHQGFSAISPKYRTSHSTTAMIDLSPSEDEIFASFRGRCRRNIRTATKKGVIVRNALDRNDALELLRVQDRMADIKNMDTAGIPDIPKLLDIIQRKQEGTMLVAELEGKIIGGISMVKEGARAYMQIIAVSPDHPRIPQSSILYWESMKKMKAQGCTVYDLVGFPEGGIENARNSAEKGRTHFKLEFNPEIANLVAPHVIGLRPISHFVLFNLRQYYLKSPLRSYLIPLLKRKKA